MVVSIVTVVLVVVSVVGVGVGQCSVAGGCDQYSKRMVFVVSVIGVVGG